jgi:hypothetical protein
VPSENNKNVKFLVVEVYCSSSSEPTWIKVELPPLSPVAPPPEPVAEISAEQRNPEEEARYKNTFSKIRMNVAVSTG